MICNNIFSSTFFFYQNPGELSSLSTLFLLTVILWNLTLPSFLDSSSELSSCSSSTASRASVIVFAGISLKWLEERRFGRLFYMACRISGPPPELAALGDILCDKLLVESSCISTPFFDSFDSENGSYILIMRVSSLAVTSLLDRCAAVSRSAGAGIVTTEAM